MTDIQLRREKDTNAQLLSNLEIAQKEIEALNSKIAEMEEKHSKEIKEVTGLLENSLRREKELRRVSKDAHNLLTLYSIQNISGNTTALS